jgi:DNA-3-methyladenine glycosylase
MPNSWNPLRRSFFHQPTMKVAESLLGAVLVRRAGRAELAGKIVEVEAYIGEDDPACHAYHGRTERTEVMYGPPGRAYVYFTYGMHFMLNVVTEPEGFPAAVLIRALEPLAGIETMRRRRGGVPDRELTNGPAKLCAALAIDGRHNRADLLRSPLFIAAGAPPDPASIRWSPRIGIREGRDRAWRCFVDGSPYVSRGRPGVPPPERLRQR